jgi:hypothetical protein
MRDEPKAAWLVLGGLHLLNGSSPLRPDEIVTLVPVDPLELSWPSNTIVLSWAELGEVEPMACTMSRGLVATGRERADRLFSGLLPGSGLLQLIEAAGGDGRESYVPLCYLSARPDPSGSGWLAHAYGQIRFLESDACFIRLTDGALSMSEVSELSFLPEVLARHAEHALFLNNHQCYYGKLFPGFELEHKYTFEHPIDIWRLTARLYARLRFGSLPEFIMEYRDEFQAWDYMNHLFEIPGPPQEQGYVSFIPTTDGRHTMKRKWYGQDAFRRREEMRKGVVIEGSLDAYVADTLGLTARRLPSFRRARYDVNFESVRTGHVYGIFFDQSTVIDTPEHRLYQCELEYLRTRSVVPAAEQDVLDELERIATWLETFLREEGLQALRGVYSKLSFLRDVTAGRCACQGGM